MTGKSRSRKSSRVASRTDLGTRILKLRNDLGWSQLKFAEKLEVSRTQIVAWEVGRRESPSHEKLVEMAKLARRQEERLWFLRRAELDLDFLRIVFREDARAHLRPLDRGDSARVPVIEGFAADEKGEIAPQFRDLLPLYISPQQIERPDATVGVVARNEATLLGPLPFPLSVGDIAIVDQTQIYPADFIDEQRGHGDRLAALLLPRLPEWLDAFPVSPEVSARAAGAPVLDVDKERKLRALQRAEDPVAFDANERPNDAKLGEILSRAGRPVLLFGSIREQWIGERWAELLDEDAEAKKRWRLCFFVDPSRGIALSDWMDDRLPREMNPASMKHGARIFGAVVGWLATPKGATERALGEKAQLEKKASSRLDCECSRRCSCICHWDASYQHIEPCCGPGSKAHEALCDVAKRRRAAGGREVVRSSFALSLARESRESSGGDGLLLSPSEPISGTRKRRPNGARQKENAQ